MKVGVDVSPLVQTRAGTARHVNGLLGALAGRDVDVTRALVRRHRAAPRPSLATPGGTTAGCRVRPAGSTSSTARPSAARCARRFRSR